MTKRETMNAELHTDLGDMNAEQWDSLIAQMGSGTPRSVNFERGGQMYRLIINNAGVFIDRCEGDRDVCVLGLEWSSIAETLDDRPGPHRPVVYVSNVAQESIWGYLCVQVADQIRKMPQRYLKVILCGQPHFAQTSGMAAVMHAAGSRCPRLIEYAVGAFDDIWPSVSIGAHENPDLGQIVLLPSWEMLYQHHPNAVRHFMRNYDYPGVVVAAMASAKSLTEPPSAAKIQNASWLLGGFDIKWVGMRSPRLYGWLHDLADRMTGEEG